MLMVSVEANIGSGKSTFLRLLQHHFNDRVNVIYEPLNEWQTEYSDKDGNNILGLFYDDPKRWGYTFQANAFLTRIQKKNREYEDGKLNITERSVFSDRHVFASMLKADGLINEIEWKYYTNWYNWLVPAFDIKPELYIYLRCSPERSYDRLKKRQRSEESTVPLDYLRRLHEYHENWLLNEKDTPVCILNVDDDFEKNKETFYRMASNLEKYM